MKIFLKKPYKSIDFFPEVDVSNFIVLTGVNGAGKSHLLEGLENGSLEIEGVPPNQQHGPRLIRKFDGNSLVPSDTGSFSGAQISNEVAAAWSSILQFRKQQLESVLTVLRSLRIPKFKENRLHALAELDVPALMADGMQEHDAINLLSNVKAQLDGYENFVATNFIQQDPGVRNRLAKEMQIGGRWPFCFIEREEFYKIYPTGIQVVDLFQQSFAKLFSGYQHNWRENRLKKEGAIEDPSMTFLTDSEFVERFGEPPWDFVNEILTSAELDFHIDWPDKWLDRIYDPVLKDPSRGIEIKFSDLSSGERILMSFALCLYHASDRRSSVEYPQVLLFDEIDAPLHPSMTRSLLKTIEHVLVNQRGIKVILTTHSPSTVALAPDSSIYIMKKSGDPRFSKVSKDAALGVLTSGVPTLSINYENRRQVFVESKYDVQFYSALYEKAKDFLDREISIVFIASGVAGNGNCDQVQSVVDKLVEGGNKTVFGVVDWDLKNQPSRAVLVLGENERYAIDNYLLDPLLVALLLIREKFVLLEEIGVEGEWSYVKMLSTAPRDLQPFVDKIVSLVGARISMDISAENDVISFRYAGGGAVEVPKWFARLNGHNLEKALKEAFPPLLRYRGEADLKQRIIDFILDDCPDFIPENFVSLFLNIQQAKPAVVEMH